MRTNRFVNVLIYALIKAAIVICCASLHVMRRCFRIEENLREMRTLFGSTSTFCVEEIMGNINETVSFVFSFLIIVIA